MDPDREPRRGAGAREGGDVVLMRMHAAGRHQPHQVDGAVLDRGDEFGERRVLGKRSVGNRLVDAWQVLHHHPAGAEIHVPDLGIAHLPGGQADMQLRRLQVGNRRFARQPVEIGRARVHDRIVVSRLVAVAPAVKHAQHDRALAGNEAHGAVILGNVGFI